MRIIRKSVHKSRWARLLPLVLLIAACGGGDTSGGGATASAPADSAATSADAPTEPAASATTVADASPTDDATAPDSPTADTGSDAGAASCEGSVVVGSTNFDEQELVAEMYALALEQAGCEVERRYQLGAREVVFPALEAGEIDVTPEYVGTLLEFLNDGAGEASADLDASLELLRGYAEERGIDVLEPSAAEDKNALVVTQETAEEFGLGTVSDLQEVAGELVFGGPPECPERPLCLPGYEEAYGLEFAEFRSLDAGGPITAEALQQGEIDVALLFSTDGVIAANDWVLLEDDEGLQPAENIVPVVRSEVNTDGITATLNGVSELLTTENVTELIRQVRIDAADPADASQGFLADEGLLEG